MKIVKIGDWEDAEKELYGGEGGLVITCKTMEELIKLCTKEVREALFKETELELEIKVKSAPSYKSDLSPESEPLIITGAGK